MPRDGPPGMATGRADHRWCNLRSIRRDGDVLAKRLMDRSFANIVKAHAKRVGLDPALFSGHSLGAGFLTSAAERGASRSK